VIGVSATRLAAPARLPATLKALLVVEVLLTYVRVRFLVRSRPIAAVAGAMRPPVAPLRDPDAALRIGWRLADPVRRVLEPGPWDARCLMRSLVLLNMLGRRGIASTLVIGVRPGEELGAHAWIEYERRPLRPTLGFEPLTVI
jgi:hypothetical protein